MESSDKWLNRRDGLTREISVSADSPYQAVPTPSWRAKEIHLTLNSDCFADDHNHFVSITLKTLSLTIYHSFMV